MNLFVGVCSVLFLGAVGFLLLTLGGTLTPLLDAVRPLPPVQKFAWAVVVAVPFVLLGAAIWLSDRLMRQRRATSALERRLGVVSGEVQGLARSQADVDAMVNYLARTDPEDAVSGLQRRISEAERFTQLQQSRNEVDDLQSRVDDIRNQQQALKERLDTVAEKRRSIEQLFMELDRNQNDIERTLSDIEGEEDRADLDNHLRRLAEFIKGTHYRFEQIERGLATLLQQKNEFRALQTRLAPLEAEQGGIRSLIQELNDLSETLSGNLGDLEKLPEGSLTEGVNRLAERGQAAAERVAALDEEFSRLATIRRDIGGLFVNLGHALDALAGSEGNEDGSNLGARLREVSQFIAGTQSRFEDIERAMRTLAQMKMEIDGLQTRLAPLESEQDGIKHRIDDLRSRRDQLVARIRRLERDDEGALDERVQLFTESKRELEARVTSLNEEFSKLAAIRKDIGALLAKLSGTLSASLG
jgi:chromosome segregation ATPase